MNRHILVSHFGQLASLVWAKLILGRFRDAVLPDFLDFLLVPTFTSARFSLILRMGDIAVDMSQGLVRLLFATDEPSKITKWAMIRETL